MKHKKLLIGAAVVAVILVVASIGNYWDSQKPAPAASSQPPAASDPAPAASPAEPAKSEAEEKAEILAVVEALVDDAYKGTSYSCDILTRTDGAGYTVSMQINVDVIPPESTEIISGLETAIQGLGYDQIAEIQILAFKETQKEIGLVDSNMDLDPSAYKIPAE